MNFDTIRKTLLMGAVGVFVWWAWKAPAQDTLNASAKVPYAVSQVIQLEQAKIGDDTVIAYIRNSGDNYNLSANDILYLRQQGVSDAVLTAMLTQPKTGYVPANSPQPVAPPPQYSAPAPAPDTSAYANYADTAPTTVVQPTTTYVQTAPTTYDYSNYYPYSYSYPYYYPYYGYYGYYPWCGWGWGWWGGGWHWGWGWHSGVNTGWHGGWGGGWHGGWGGGGFHGAVGGGFHGGTAFHGGGGGGWHGGGGFHGGGGRR